nr:uncharacterized protein LOC124805886 [Hydra vulgaris]
MLTMTSALLMVKIHCMAKGIIAVDTKDLNQPLNIPIRIKRVLSQITEMHSQNKFPILLCDTPEMSCLSKIIFKPIFQLQSPSIILLSTEIDLLWHLLNTFCSIRNRPQWNGFKQKHQKSENHSPKSDFFMLPIININPLDKNCIYSALILVKNQAKALGVPPSVTFEQPLWIKAFEIANSQNLGIVVRLGGFHTLISFLGSIGTIMKGSGFERLLEPIYAKNSICHIISGKAVARELCAHFLVESALTTLLLEGLEATYDQSALKEIYQKLVNQIIKLDNVNKSSIIAVSQKQPNSGLSIFIM